MIVIMIDGKQKHNNKAALELQSSRVFDKSAVMNYK